MILKERNSLNNTDIDTEYLEQIKSYKYLGSIVNRYNSFGEEIKIRITPWEIKLITYLRTYTLT